MTAQVEQADQTSPPTPAAVRFGVVAWLRWGWRQLTSMRTALVLLFLLALASIPGSVLPQEGIDPAAVTAVLRIPPGACADPGQVVRVRCFRRALVRCDLPAVVYFAGRLRAAARRPDGQVGPPATARGATAPEPATAGHQLRRGRISRSGAGRSRPACCVPAGSECEPATAWVSAEKGYLHEVGNLLFHLALLGLLASVAMGGLFGYKANRLLVAGSTFANTPTSLDVFRPGRLVSATDLQPFTLTLSSFSASYVTSGAQRGEPASFSAALSYSATYGGRVRDYDLQVNHPLNVDGVQIFLIGHGYAPVFKVTDGAGTVVFNQPLPFIPGEHQGFLGRGGQGTGRRSAATRLLR